MCQNVEDKVTGTCRWVGWGVCERGRGSGGPPGFSRRHEKDGVSIQTCNSCGPAGSEIAGDRGPQEFSFGVSLGCPSDARGVGGCGEGRRIEQPPGRRSGCFRACWRRETPAVTCPGRVTGKEQGWDLTSPLTPGPRCEPCVVRPTVRPPCAGTRR